jgi:two-component system LytT family response regulator
LINAVKPDLVFLDVEMPNHTGYEIANFFDEIDFQIIFVTAYNQYAVKAFEVNAVDYILKPIERKKLTAAVQKVGQRIQLDQKALKYHQLLNDLTTNKAPTISFSEGGKKHLVQVESIIAICANGAYSQVLLEDSKTLLLSKNIGAIELALQEKTPFAFFRAHKSWIVNLSHVLSYSKGEQQLTLSNDVIAKVSRFKKAELESLL